MHWSSFVSIAVALAGIEIAVAQELDDLRVGHWVIIKGQYLGEDRFEAAEIAITLPSEEHELLGEITRVDEVRRRLWLFDQTLTTSDSTELPGGRLQDLVGERVKIEGHYRGPHKFSAGEIALRDSGRDRVTGRVDELIRAADGSLELVVTRYRVQVAAGTEIAIEIEGKEEGEGTLEEIPLAEMVVFSVPEREGRDDDDDVPLSFAIGESASLGVQFEWRTDDEREFDLDSEDSGDRRDDSPALRADMLYDPEGNFSAFIGLRHTWRFRNDEEDGYEDDETFRVAEVYGLWRDAAPGLDVRIGRQDFDDRREWLYDENLDAVRLHWGTLDLNLELSASTVVADGSDRQENTRNFIAYLSNRDKDKHLAAYVIDRRTDLAVRDYPLFFGLRAIGEWLPDQEMWAELATVVGYEGDTDISGYGFDLGTTWSPDSIEPWYGSIGIAYGSGDDDLSDGEDSSFRQTGLQDNSSKLGGVTSFSYYGELFDPELSNLLITTLGIGRRFGRNHSLDLVWHLYRQAEAFEDLRDTSLDRRPNGESRDIGNEVDLVWGSRWQSSWSLEVVLAAFDPGDAFDDDDLATYGKVQLRYRF